MTFIKNWIGKVIDFDSLAEEDETKNPLDEESVVLAVPHSAKTYTHQVDV